MLRRGVVMIDLDLSFSSSSVGGAGVKLMLSSLLLCSISLIFLSNFWISLEIA